VVEHCLGDDTSRRASLRKFLGLLLGSLVASAEASDETALSAVGQSRPRRGEPLG
jgi:hypothetical protein